MRPLTCLIAAGMLAVAAVSANAATVAYGEALDTLYRIDLDARTATAVGAAGKYAGQDIVNISGLVQTGENAFYAVAGGFKLLLRIDPTSGAATAIGSLGLSGQGSGQFDPLDLNMTAACDGTLWLASAAVNKLWTVNPGTGATTLVGSTGAAISGLAAHGNLLYGAGAKGDNRLYRLDPVSGAATPIGAYGTDRWINTVSLSFAADGTLWAVLNYVPPQHDSDTPADWSDLARIDPATGKMSVLGPITGPASLRRVGIKGLTVGPAPCAATAAPQPAPVDAPWALALLAGLLALTAAAGRRRFAA